MLSARGLRPAFANAAVQWDASRHTVIGKNRQDVYVMHSVPVSVSVCVCVSVSVSVSVTVTVSVSVSVVCSVECDCECE